MKWVCKALLIFLPLLYGCDDKLEPPKTDVLASEIPDQESWGSTVIFSDSGNVKAILYAQYIAYFKKHGYTLIDSGAKVDFFKNGEIASTLTGKSGKYFDRNKDIEINDSVVVVNNEGSTLFTDKLYWNNNTQRVSSDKYVKIVTPKEEVEGVGFESDQNLKNYVIYKVTGTFVK